MTAVEDVLAACVAGAWLYCALTVIAVFRYLRKPIHLQKPETSFISVLVPLVGAEPSLELNLRSLFEQEFSSFEILFAVSNPADPAAALVELLRRQYPQVRCRLLVTGRAPYANADVFSFEAMAASANYDWLVMSSGDVRASKNFLRRLSAELSGGPYDLASCPYRAVAPLHLWPTLEAIGINTEFWSTALLARLFKGVRFAEGPTVVAHRKVLDAVPWATLGTFLAEDFVLGQLAAKKGFRVDLSSVVVERHLNDESPRQNMSSRLRWARSMRRLRPWAYFGQLFAQVLPLALILLTMNRGFWPVLLVSILFRAALAYAVGSMVLKDHLWVRRLPLIVVQDLLRFAFWIVGFAGDEVAWRGQRYKLRRDGSFLLIA